MALVLSKTSLYLSDGWHALGKATIANAEPAYGEFFPDSTNTGLSDPSLLTIQATNVTYSDTGPNTPSKIIINKDFQGMVYITGANYIFINCKFSGPLNPTSATVQTRYSTTNNIYFEHCYFNPRTKNANSGNIIGRGWHAKRCDFEGGIDGCGPSVADGGTRTDVILEGCYIHDLLRYCPYPSQGDNQSHSDVIQWAGGLGLTLLGCRLDGRLNTGIGTGWAPATYSSGVLTGGHPNYPNPVSISTLMINALGNVIQPGEFIMHKCWVRGGSVAMNAIGVPSAFITWDGITEISENWFMKDQGSGTNHLFLGKSAQTSLDSASGHIHDNYVWNPANPFDTSTPQAYFKVNV